MLEAAIFSFPRRREREATVDFYFHCELKVLMDVVWVCDKGMEMFFAVWQDDEVSSTYVNYIESCTVADNSSTPLQTLPRIGWQQLGREQTCRGSFHLCVPPAIEYKASVAMSR